MILINNENDNDVCKSCQQTQCYIQHQNKKKAVHVVYIRNIETYIHPVSVPRWGLLDSPRKILNFKKFSGVRAWTKFPTGEITKPARDNMKILRG